MGCHSLLQEIFPSQGSSPGLLHLLADSFPLSHQGSPPGTEAELKHLKGWDTLGTCGITRVHVLPARAVLGRWLKFHRLGSQLISKSHLFPHASCADFIDVAWWNHLCGTHNEPAGGAAQLNQIWFFKWPRKTAAAPGANYSASQLERLPCPRGHTGKRCRVLCKCCSVPRTSYKCHPQATSESLAEPRRPNREFTSLRNSLNGHTVANSFIKL